MNTQPQRRAARDRGWPSISPSPANPVMRDVREPEAPASADETRLCEDARVRAVVDVPEYQVNRGEVGVVCSTWNLPWRLVEVEFACIVTGEIKRALLNPDQVEIHDEAAPDGAPRDPELPDTCDETEDELQPA